MAGIMTLSKEQLNQTRTTLADLKKILDEKPSLIRSGVMTEEDFAQAEAAYNAAKLLVDKFAPQPIQLPPGS